MAVAKRAGSRSALRALNPLDRRSLDVRVDGEELGRLGALRPVAVHADYTSSARRHIIAPALRALLDFPSEAAFPESTSDNLSARKIWL